MDVNMLGLGMKLEIFSKTDGCLIIAVDLGCRDLWEIEALQ